MTRIPSFERAEPCMQSPVNNAIHSSRYILIRIIVRVKIAMNGIFLSVGDISRIESIV